MFGIFQNAALRDARAILHDIDPRLLRVAWEEFLRLRKVDDRSIMDSEMFKVAAPVWVALELVVNYDGRFYLFSHSEMKFLKFLRNAPNTYRAVAEVLSMAKYSDADAENVFETHQELSEVITPDFAEYKQRDLIKVLVDVARYFQERIQVFVREHAVEMDRAINQLERQAA